MPRRKGMKLDQALKLYIASYCCCFLLTWLVSVPMLIHVTPQSECLLFVTPYVKYGPAAACNFVGFAPLLVAAATLVLTVLHIIQLRSLKAFLRKPGPHSSDYHHRPTHIFWRMVVFHGLVTLVVLIIAAIVTAGYVTTCENLYQDVRNTVRKRVEVASYGGGEAVQQNYDVFADDRSINRYTNDYRDSWGRNSFEYGITCRNILTDPEVHSQLKQNHAENPYYKHYYGFWYKSDIADVGNIRYYTYRNNMIVELAMAGSWLSFAIWLAILILMIKERHHIKAHLTDESMWGSEFGGGSRRSGSRMSNQSFDKRSQYSNQSGSRYSRSNRPQAQVNYIPSVDQMPAATSMPLATSNATQNTLLSYFQPEEDGIVDVDAAINGEIDFALQSPHENHGFDNDPSYLDTSFESTGFPAGLDNHDGMENDPIPLGDEVSMGVISRESDNLSFPSQSPMPMPDPNRVQGRRGGRRSVSRTSYNGFPLPPTSPSSAEEPYPTPTGYRTRLANQSRI